MSAGDGVRKASGRAAGWLRAELFLAVLVVVEAVIFAVWGRNFLTPENLSNVFRHSVEVSLLALVLMPVILGGGIDLSVGSTLGLCAVVFGKAWRDGGLPWPLAALVAVLVGGGAGTLNGWLVVRFRLPALIVTLGTYSLYRGMAEALTRGTDAFTAFPESFLWLGTGEWAGVPVPAWGLALAAGVVWAWIHGTRWGREYRVIGFTEEGALHAGVPVGRRRILAHAVAGLAAGVAALTYTARLGTAKADAGMGIELVAITAVVLGGTSIHGGRGTVWGTLLGAGALAILANGLTRLPWTMSLAGELSGLLTGLLLVLALAGGRWLGRRAE